MVVALVITMEDTEMVRVVVVAKGAGPTGMSFRAQLGTEVVSPEDTLIGSIECTTEGEAVLLVEAYNTHPSRPSGGDISLSQVLDKVRGI